MIHVVENIVNSPEFATKVASIFPNAVRSSLGATLGMSGNPDRDLPVVVSEIAKVAYIQRRERSLINSGLQALQEIENEY